MPRRFDYRDGLALSLVGLLAVIAAALALGASQ